MKCEDGDYAQRTVGGEQMREVLFPPIFQPRNFNQNRLVGARNEYFYEFVLHGIKERKRAGCELRIVKWLFTERNAAGPLKYWLNHFTSQTLPLDAHACKALFSSFQQPLGALNPEAVAALRCR